MPTRFTTSFASQPTIAIDLGYSAKTKSCGLAFSNSNVCESLKFGDCVQRLIAHLVAHGPHCLIIEAVLSTYHDDSGNPNNRGDFEKGRGWYYGPGVTTFAAAQRLLTVLDHALPAAMQIPIIEGFLSYKPARTQHTEDAQRMILEFESAEVFQPHAGSQPILPNIEGVPLIKRYNKPPNE